MDHNKAKRVLAGQIRVAFDDLFTSDKKANAKTVDQLKGWFKTKTSAGDAVAQKMASTFKSLAQYADFESTAALGSSEQSQPATPPGRQQEPSTATESGSMKTGQLEGQPAGGNGRNGSFGLVYRFEIHLPDTQNVDTFRAIFKALREELM
jgi:hypothetical protein